MARRAFIFGAGFSYPAGMPVATKLLEPLKAKVEGDEMHEWLDGLCQRLAWFSGDHHRPDSFNIEEIFHYAQFDVEVHRLKQHLADVGRRDGPGTPWNEAESVQAWLSYLEEALRDVIFECDDRCNLSPINRWAMTVSEHDAVLTFNYDTLVERALEANGKAWNHGARRDDEKGIGVHKLHGSIDWIVAHRNESFSKLDLLFDKKNANRTEGSTGYIEEDCRLWRCQTREQLRNWIEGRELQSLPEDASPRTVGIAGLGAYKGVHQIPGLGYVWTNGMQALYKADMAVVVGFSMSDFDTMAKMQFVEVARARAKEGRPLPVLVIDPSVNEAAENRFRQVFRHVHFVRKKHEEFDWGSIG